MKRIYDVLVVGSGPTGTALAIDLVRRGLEVRVIDKAPQAFGGSRAKGVQPRTMEVFHDLDVIDDILAGGSLYPKLGIHLGPFTIPWRMFHNVEATVATPYPNTWLIPQFRIDGALHAGLQRLGATVEFGKELVEFSQGPDTVTAKVASDHGIEEIEARYLVGSDGGSSAVRKMLGIEFVGSTDEQDRILVVDAVTTGLSRNRWHVWPKPGGRFIGACHLPNSDLFQWMIRLAPGQTPPKDLHEIADHIASHTGNRRLKLHGIQWQSVFRPNIRLAERYRSGRIFIAGDAAHVHTPAGAQGLNTGTQDAYNLGWKLAQVLAGASDQLLDSYDAERRPIAAGVLGLSTKKYNAIGKLDPSAIRRGKDEQQLKLTYQGGPLASSDSNRTKTLRAGDRAPDAVLLQASGQHIRLFQIFKGPHFTALAYGAVARECLERVQWPEAGAKLKRILIDAGEGPGSHAMTDSEHVFKKVYGLSSDAIILVRPDGYIAHISTADMFAATQSAALQMTPPLKGPQHASNVIGNEQFFFKALKKAP